VQRQGEPGLSPDTPDYITPFTRLLREAGLGVATCWAYGEGVKKGTDILQHVAALDPQHLSDPLRAIPYLASEFSTQVSILSRGGSLLPMR